MRWRYTILYLTIAIITALTTILMVAAVTGCPDMWITWRWCHTTGTPI
jgi:hypothetical protein